MKAVVLAAGTGSRLGGLTAERPKCLVELAGRSLLDWQLDALHAAGIDDISIVTGYKPELLAGRANREFHNPRYAETNMVVSLLSARELFDGSDDILVAYGDIVYEPRLVEALRDPQSPVAVAVDANWLDLWKLRMPDPLADAETLRVSADGHLLEIGNKPASYADIEAQYIGLIAIRSDFAPEVVSIYDSLGPERDRMYMTALLQLLIDSGVAVAAVRVANGWLEVDTPQDLAVYEDLRGRNALDRIVNLAAAR